MPKWHTLELCGVRRAFGSVVALDDVSFSVMPGQIAGFIGPNGAGKTTAMRIAATLDLPDEGDVRVAGISALEDPRAVRAQLGFMPDAVAMEPHTSVQDFLDFHARAAGLRGAARRRSIDDVAAFTGLGPLMKKLCTALSKGMRQRVLLAHALLHDPAVLLLDEPAAGLDPRARVELRELLRALAGLGKAALVSSHILSELAEICHTVVVIEAGRVRAQGRIGEIARALRPHREVTVRALAPPEVLLAALSELPHVQDARLVSDGARFQTPGDDEVVADVLAGLVAAGARPVEFSAAEVDLEDLFLSLTDGTVQ